MDHLRTHIHINLSRHCVSTMAMVMVYNYLCRHSLHACLYLLSVATKPPDYHVSETQWRSQTRAY